MKHIPNLLTLCNLFCGVLGIILCFNDQLFLHADKQVIISANSQLYLAGVMILFAAFFDFLDGMVARLLNAHSPIGGSLDSLADVVSFGVLPSLICYRLLSLQFFKSSLSFETSIITAIPAIFIALAAAYRLAKFNHDASQTTFFKGLPSPANGVFWAGLGIASRFPTWYFTFINTWILLAMALVFSYLMISNFNMLSFKSFSMKGNSSFPWIALAIAFIISISFFKLAALPIIIISYIFISLLLFKPQNTTNS